MGCSGGAGKLIVVLSGILRLVSSREKLQRGLSFSVFFFFVLVCLLPAPSVSNHHTSTCTLSLVLHSSLSKQEKVAATARLFGFCSNVQAGSSHEEHLSIFFLFSTPFGDLQAPAKFQVQIVSLIFQVQLYSPARQN